MVDDNTRDQLETALALIYSAIHLNNDGLRANPDKPEKRKLLKRRARLEAERANLEGMVDALADGEDIDVQPPTAEQVQAIADLTGEVEQQTQAAVTASAALVLTGKVLDLAIKLTGD